MSNYKYINTRMGTFNSQRYSNGNVYPITAVPHGMNFFTIQTNVQKFTSWFYSPMDKSFEGIRLTHMPSPHAGDYGKLLIWGERDRGYKPENRWSSFDNHKAILEPAYIHIKPHRDNYEVELTPTNACAIMRFTFKPMGMKNRIVMECDKFECEFNKVTNTLYIADKQYYFGDFHFGNDVNNVPVEHVIIKFNVQGDFSVNENHMMFDTDENVVECRIATSYISKNQAMLNLSREVESKSFEEVKTACEAEWDEYLSRIDIEDEDEEKKKTFYSCMYRAFLWPRKFYEIDENGKEIHLNTATGGVAEGKLYSDNGFWDTFRTLYPFLSLIDTKLYHDMAEGYYSYFEDTGWLPKWVRPHNENCMPGMLIEATMGDAIVKDIVTDELAHKIFKAMLKDGEYESEVKGEGRIKLSLYRKYGYVPYTQVVESVNETLDNSFGDYAIGAAAKKLGYDHIAKKYFEYSKNYKNLFDPEVGFMRGKDEDGNFRSTPFNSLAWWGDYTEGSAWQNSFGVYHDIKGLNELYEGKLEEKIDELMSLDAVYDVGEYRGEVHEMSEMACKPYGQCAISNQPSFHLPYIYSELDNPEKTSFHVSNIAKLFNSGFEGYPGDEDNGSMSSWFLLSAIGLYQMAPSRADFDTSVPLFDKIIIKLANGNVLNINKADFDTSNMEGIVSYFDVMKGGNLWDIVRKK
ncbi:MAG: glycoside hydrolase family 92 protein [Clostridiales bacterium]|nr:glycoside hydrolase family 92 protein [Clostridiales bacterium]